MATTGYRYAYYLDSWEVPENESSKPTFNWVYDENIMAGINSSWMADTDFYSGPVISKYFYSDGTSFITDPGPWWANLTFSRVTTSWSPTGLRVYVNYTSVSTEESAILEKYSGKYTGFVLSYADTEGSDGETVFGNEDTQNARDDLGTDSRTIRYLLESKISEMAELLVESTTATKLMFKQILEPTFASSDLSNLSTSFTEISVPGDFSVTEEDLYDDTIDTGLL